MKEEGKRRSSFIREWTWNPLKNYPKETMEPRGAETSLTGKFKVKAYCFPHFTPISYPAGWELVRKILSLVENKEASFSLHICYVNCDPSNISNTSSIVFESLLGQMSFSGSVVLWARKASSSKTYQCTLCLAPLDSTALQVWLVLVQKMKNAFWPTFPCTDKDPNCAITSWYINLCQVSHNIISANEILKVLFSLLPNDRTERFIERW